MPLFPLIVLRRKRLDPHDLCGYVVGESDTLIALHRVNDQYALDGYCIIRRRDVTLRSDSFPRKALTLDALRLKQQHPVEPVGLDLTSIASAMHSVQQSFDALVIHRERMVRDEVEVGTIRLSTRHTYTLRWLTPDAEWEDDDRPFRYRDVTLIGFGAEYEVTLTRVAQARQSQSWPD